MRRFQYTFAFLIISIVSSCNNAVKKMEMEESEAIVDETNNELDDALNEAIIENESPQHLEGENITHIRFKEFSFAIQSLTIYDEDNELDQIQNNQVEIYAEVGETIEGQLISISSALLTGFTVEQRYETSITIMDEGPHCDLTEWKHFYSEWKQLKTNKSGHFVCESYTENESKKFPKISMDDLREIAAENCGESWSELLENVKKPTEYPSAVGISRYFLRITGKRKDNGQTVTKMIIIETPMGC